MLNKYYNIERSDNPPIKIENFDTQIEKVKEMIRRDNPSGDFEFIEEIPIRKKHSYGNVLYGGTLKKYKVRDKNINSKIVGIVDAFIATDRSFFLVYNVPVDNISN